MTLSLLIGLPQHLPPKISGRRVLCIFKISQGRALHTPSSNSIHRRVKPRFRCSNSSLRENVGQSSTEPCLNAREAELLLLQWLMNDGVEDPMVEVDPATLTKKILVTENHVLPVKKEPWIVHDESIAMSTIDPPLARTESLLLRSQAFWPALAAAATSFLIIFAWSLFTSLRRNKVKNEDISNPNSPDIGDVFTMAVPLQEIEAPEESFDALLKLGGFSNDSPRRKQEEDESIDLSSSQSVLTRIGKEVEILSPPLREIESQTESFDALLKLGPFSNDFPRRNQEEDESIDLSSSQPVLPRIGKAAEIMSPSLREIESQTESFDALLELGGFSTDSSPRRELEEDNSIDLSSSQSVLPRIDKEAEILSPPLREIESQTESFDAMFKLGGFSNDCPRIKQEEDESIDLSSSQSFLPRIGKEAEIMLPPFTEIEALGESFDALTKLGGFSTDSPRKNQEEDESINLSLSQSALPRIGEAAEIMLPPLRDIESQMESFSHDLPPRRKHEEDDISSSESVLPEMSRESEITPLLPQPKEIKSQMQTFCPKAETPESANTNGKEWNIQSMAMNDLDVKILPVGDGAGEVDYFHSLMPDSGPKPESKPQLFPLGSFKSENDKPQNRKHESFDHAIQAALPALVVGIGAVGSIAGAAAGLKFIGFASTASFIAREILWAQNRNNLWQDVMKISDRKKLRYFLKQYKILKDTP